MDPNEQDETMDPEVEAEILQRHDTPGERSTVSVNELRHRAAVSAQQQA